LIAQLQQDIAKNEQNISLNKSESKTEFNTNFFTY